MTPLGYLIDSSVIIDVITRDAAWGEWSEAALAAAVRSSATYINPIVYAEVSADFDDVEDLDRRLPVKVFRRAPIPYSAAFVAQKAHLAYRRRGGTRTATLPDFLIGAHALVENFTLVTRDARRFRTAFPTLAVIAPE